MERCVQVRNLKLGEGKPKICVPVVGRSEEEIYRQAQELKSAPADLVEWRADWFEGLKERERLLAVLKSLRTLLEERPLLFTIRTKGEGGEANLSFSEYQRLNLEAAGSGCVDLVDVELLRMSVGQAEGLQQENAAELRCALQREGVTELIRDLQKEGVRVIGSSHDFAGTPGMNTLVDCMRAMQEVGADICKLAVMPQGQEDVVNLLQATWQMKSCYGDRPWITMSMGALGVLSRLSGELFGSAVTFGAVGQSSAPGQVEAEALAGYLELLHAEAKGEEAFGGHVFLIGFMGTGKSTVARVLRERLCRQQVEMDARLEEQEGQTIASMFEQYGEEYFRKKETALLYSLEQEEPAVISCGGGVVTREVNTAFMKEHGRIVLLTASPETVLQRVQGSQERPILNGNMNVEYIEQLMERRRASYEAAADLTVSTDGRTVEEICEEIISKLNLS